jgi:hypothetical protein
MLGLTVLEVAVPAALLAWLAVGPAPSRGAWLARTGLVGSYLLTIALAGLWLAVPRWVLWLWVGAYPVAALIGFGRTARTAWLPSSAAAWIRLAGVLAPTLLLTGGAVASAYARGAPVGRAVELEFPLQEGTYLVANGGRSPLLNAHLGIPDSAMERYGGQVHGLDLVRIDRFGKRARGLRPFDPAAYAIFGDTVRAPCHGVVIAALDGLDDLNPPAVDRSNMAGNHVVIACDARTWVFLAHLRRGSVSVSIGDSVRAGRAVGAVGNTGNSDEPHLHIHAQTPGTRENPVGGDPLPMRFQGRSLARNDRIDARRGTDQRQ